MTEKIHKNLNSAKKCLSMQCHARRVNESSRSLVVFCDYVSIHISYIYNFTHIIRSFYINKFDDFCNNFIAV